MIWQDNTSFLIISGYVVNVFLIVAFLLEHLSLTLLSIELGALCLLDIVSANILDYDVIIASNYTWSGNRDTKTQTIHIELGKRCSIIGILMWCRFQQPLNRFSIEAKNFEYTTQRAFSWEMATITRDNTIIAFAELPEIVQAVANQEILQRLPS